MYTRFPCTMLFRSKRFPIEPGQRLMGMARLEGFSVHRLLHASVDPAPVIGDILFCGGHENRLENRYERPASPNRQRRSPDHLRVASRTLSAALPAAD